MKARFIIFCIFVFFAICSTMAQDKPKFVGVGMAFNQDASPQIQGFGALAIPISDRVLSFTDYLVSAIPQPRVGGKLQLPKIQYVMRTGIAVKIYAISPKLTLWGMGNAGVAADGGATSGSFAGGGFVDWSLGKGWGALVILQVDKNAATGTQFIPRVGVRKIL
jgi:hypothetical protein